MQPGPPYPPQLPQPRWTPPPPPYYDGRPPVYPPRPPARQTPWGPIVGFGGFGLVVVLVVATYLLVAMQRASQPGSYVYGDRDTAIFVQWVEHDGTLTGSVQHTYWQQSDASLQQTMWGAPPTGHIFSESLAFTGTMGGDGSHVTLTIPVLGGSRALSGTPGGQALMLEWPQAGGVVRRFVLSPGDADAYNAAVAAIHQAHPPAN